MRMQLHDDDGRARDSGGSPFASESSCARPRERRAVGARPTRQPPQRRRELLFAEAKRDRVSWVPRLRDGHRRWLDAGRSLK
jgi:hypothetical protein